MPTEIETLEKLIQKKEAALSRAESESQSLNSGKYKTSSNAAMSKVLVNSLRKEIDELYAKLQEIKGNRA